MTDVQQRVDASRHEASRHLTFAQLEAGLHALPPAPKDSGRLTGIVRSPVSEVRELLSQARLSPEAGLPGDKWGARASRKLEAQLAVMQQGVAELIANGQSLALFGDNLIVDLEKGQMNVVDWAELKVAARSKNWALSTDPQHAAPETRMGGPKARSDLYSLGSLLLWAAKIGRAHV